MAYKASDGRDFTNRPMMSAHNHRLASRKSKPPAHGMGPHSESVATHADAMPVDKESPLMAKCPACGHEFEPGMEDHAEGNPY